MGQEPYPVAFRRLRPAHMWPCVAVHFREVLGLPKEVAIRLLLANQPVEGTVDLYRVTSVFVRVTRPGTTEFTRAVKPVSASRPAYCRSNANFVDLDSSRAVVFGSQRPSADWQDASHRRLRSTAFSDSRVPPKTQWLHRVGWRGAKLIGGGGFSLRRTSEDRLIPIAAADSKASLN